MTQNSDRALSGGVLQQMRRIIFSSLPLATLLAPAPAQAADIAVMSANKANQNYFLFVIHPKTGDVRFDSGPGANHNNIADAMGITNANFVRGVGFRDGNPAISNVFGPNNAPLALLIAPNHRVRFNTVKWLPDFVTSSLKNGSSDLFINADNVSDVLLTYGDTPATTQATDYNLRGKPRTAVEVLRDTDAGKKAIIALIEERAGKLAGRPPTAGGQNQQGGGQNPQGGGQSPQGGGGGQNPQGGGQNPQGGGQNPQGGGQNQQGQNQQGQNQQGGGGGGGTPDGPSGQKQQASGPGNESAGPPETPPAETPASRDGTRPASGPPLEPEGGTRTSTGPTTEPEGFGPRTRTGPTSGPLSDHGHIERGRQGQIDFGLRQCLDRRPQRTCQKEDCQLEWCRQRNDEQGMLNFYREARRRGIAGSTLMEDAANNILDGACLVLREAYEDCWRSADLPTSSPPSAPPPTLSSGCPPGLEKRGDRCLPRCEQLATPTAGWCSGAYRQPMRCQDERWAVCIDNRTWTFDSYTKQCENPAERRPSSSSSVSSTEAQAARDDCVPSAPPRGCRSDEVTWSCTYRQGQERGKKFLSGIAHCENDPTMLSSLHSECEKGQGTFRILPTAPRTETAKGFGPAPSAVIPGQPGSGTRALPSARIDPSVPPIAVPPPDVHINIYTPDAPMQPHDTGTHNGPHINIYTPDSPATAHSAPVPPTIDPHGGRPPASSDPGTTWSGSSGGCRTDRGYTICSDGAGNSCGTTERGCIPKPGEHAVPLQANVPTQPPSAPVAPPAAPKTATLPPPTLPPPTLPGIATLPPAALPPPTLLPPVLPGVATLPPATLPPPVRARVPTDVLPPSDSDTSNTVPPHKRRGASKPERPRTVQRRPPPPRHARRGGGYRGGGGYSGGGYSQPQVDWEGVGRAIGEALRSGGGGGGHGH
jgi:hypothetical protein